MNFMLQPASVLSDRAREVLIRELGVVDAMRFLSQFRVGSGNYTAERQQLYAGETVASLSAAIKQQRAQATPPEPSR